MSGQVGDHVVHEEDTHVHTVRGQRLGKRAVAEGGRELHMLEQSLGYGNGLLVVKEDNELIKAASNTEPSEQRKHISAYT